MEVFSSTEESLIISEAPTEENIDLEWLTKQKDWFHELML